MKSDSYKLIPQTVKESFFVVILTALYLLLTLTGCNNIVENPGTGNQTPPEDGSGLVAVTHCKAVPVPNGQPFPR